MIQRIQTLFLLAVAILQIVFIKMPLAHFILNEENIDLYASGFKSADNHELLSSTSPILLLSIVIAVLVIVTIFLYKKRLLQIRFCIYTMLLNAGLIGLVFYIINNFSKNNEISAHSYSVALVIPLAAIILLYLAFRGIRKDEVLVKAYDRLR